MNESESNRQQDARIHRVVLSGVVRPEHSRTVVIDKLAELFHTRRENIEPLLRGKPTRLAKNYAREEAMSVRAAIIDAGADCDVEVARDEKFSEEAPARKNADADTAAADDAHKDSDDAKQKTARDKTRRKTHETFPQEDALMRFVGVNTDYYRRQFARFYPRARTDASDQSAQSDKDEKPRASFVPTWNWPSFILPFFCWAIYRKMWGIAVIYLFSNFVAQGVIATLVLPIVGYSKIGLFACILAWVVSWTLCANYLYFRHACARISDAAAAESPRKTTGGVSRLGFLLAFAIFVIALLQFDSGELGGQNFSINRLLSPEIKTTATLHATALIAEREFLKGNALDESEQLEAIKRFLQAKRVRDGWDNDLELRRDAGGGILLVSPGRDGYFDTEDDIRQRINFFAR